MTAPAARDPARGIVDVRVPCAALLDAPHDVPGFRTAELADPQGAALTITQFR